MQPYYNKIAYIKANNPFCILIKFHSPKVQLTITLIGLDNDLAPNRRQAIIWANADRITDAFKWQ